VNYKSTDIRSKAFNKIWNQQRTWTNVTDFPTAVGNANGVVSKETYLLDFPHDQQNYVAVVSGSDDIRFFLADYQSHEYVPTMFFENMKLTHEAPDQYRLVDTRGNQATFYDFTVSPEPARGRLKTFTPKGGGDAVITYNPGGDVRQVVRQSSDEEEEGWKEQWDYSYITGGANSGRLQSVTLSQISPAEPPVTTTVRYVEYQYYVDADENGTLGDLKKATVKDSESGNVLDVKYYRYYDDGSSAGKLQFAFEPASYARLEAWRLANESTTDLEELTDSQVAPFADVAYEYNGSTDFLYAATKVTLQGAGCSCSGGRGVYEYSFTYDGSFNEGVPHNYWNSKTIETLPGHDENNDLIARNTYYLNAQGQVMLKIADRQAGAGQPLETWMTYYDYDNKGRVILIAHPSAVTNYDEEWPTLISDPEGEDDNYYFLKEDEGLVERFEYYAETDSNLSLTQAGGVKGYFKQHTIHRGHAGDGLLQRSAKYYERELSDIAVYPVARTSTYRTGTETPPGIETSYAYTYHTGTFGIASRTVTYPVISTSQNGPGSNGDTETTNYDDRGRVTSFIDGDGKTTTYAYADITSAVTQIIVDPGLTSQGFLNLTTTFEVDILGRTTKVTTPRGMVTYTVYNDPEYEVRTYRGWTPGNTTTGPIEVRREHRDANPSYTESLTMTITPEHASGVPTGGEDIEDAAIHALTRTFVSAGGQVSHVDAYVGLNGNPYETDAEITGATYHRTAYGYDTRGRRDRILLPTGTIERTVYDGMGRVASEWIGTDDDSWSPETPDGMVEVRTFIYDSYGSASADMADGNLTKVIESPGGSAADRVTHHFYDWRNRRVATRQGVDGGSGEATQRPFFYTEFNNWNLPIAQEQYDGDSITAAPLADEDDDGVPDWPDDNLLRAKTVTSYDNRGRVFRTEVFSVSQDDGEISEDARRPPRR
jgi:hypothetical protein